MKDAGFRIRRDAATAMPLELAVPALGRPPLRDPARALASAAARAWPTLFGYQIVIEAERV